ESQRRQKAKGKLQKAKIRRGVRAAHPSFCPLPFAFCLLPFAFIISVPTVASYFFTLSARGAASRVRGEERFEACACGRGLQARGQARVVQVRDGDGERVGRVEGRGRDAQLQKDAHHLLHLLFLGGSVADDRLL